MRLVADVGGTNVRFACAVDGLIDNVRAMRLADYASFDDALAAYVSGCGTGPWRDAAIAAAGPVVDGNVRLTNAPWSISSAGVAAALGIERVALVNDLAAVAMAIAHLGRGDSRPLGKDPMGRGAGISNRSGEEDAALPRLAVNVGTGLGAAAVLAHSGGWCVVSSEAGHMRGMPKLALPYSSGVDEAGCVEDVLSGDGLVKLAQRFAHQGAGLAQPGPASAREVFDTAREDDGRARACVLACETFARFLGCVAGDLVLATGAWGGVYLTGSVVDGWVASGRTAGFVETFADKGAMRARMQVVPVNVIECANPALVGLANMVVGPIRSA